MQNCSPCKSGTKYIRKLLGNYEFHLLTVIFYISTVGAFLSFCFSLTVQAKTTPDQEVPVVSLKTNMSEPGQWLASTLVTSTPSSNRLSPGSRQVTSLACINKAYKTNYRVEPVILCVSFPPNLYISLRAFFPHILKLLNPEH